VVVRGLDEEELTDAALARGRVLLGAFVRAVNGSQLARRLTQAASAELRASMGRAGEADSFADSLSLARRWPGLTPHEYVWLEAVNTTDAALASIPSSRWQGINAVSKAGGGPESRRPESSGCSPRELAVAAMALEALANGEPVDEASFKAFQDPVCALAVPRSRRRPNIVAWVANGLWQRGRQHPAVCPRASACVFGPAPTLPGDTGSGSANCLGSNCSSRAVGFVASPGGREQAQP